MADNRKIAGEILNRAAKVVMTERGTTHGDAENSFQMIADMWSAYLNNVHKRQTGTFPGIQITGFDVAQMMVQLKQARAIYGNGADLDHFVDSAGYSALAGMLSGSLVDKAVPGLVGLSVAELQPQNTGPSAEEMARKLADAKARNNG